MALLDAYLELYRSEEQFSKLYVSAPRIKATLLAQVTGSPDKGAMTISYNNGITLPDNSAILADQTVWLGDSPYSHSKGITRLRAITGDHSSGTIKLAENNYKLTDGTYITVLLFYGIHPKKPRHTTAGVFYKDYDIPYSGVGAIYNNPNVKSHPVILAGGNKAKFLTYGQAIFHIDLSRSYTTAPGATKVSYGISCYPNAYSTIFNTATGIGDIVFIAAGDYWVTFTLVDSNGVTQTTRRLYHVHEKNIESVYYPFVIGKPDSIVGNWSDGVWNTSIELSGNVPAEYFFKNSHVLVWSENIFGGTFVDPADLPGTKEVLFSGYLSKEVWGKDAKKGTKQVTFDAESLVGTMKNVPMFSISLNAVANPTSWWHYDKNNLKVGTAVLHVLQHHSTALQIADVEGLAADTRKIFAVEDFAEASLIDQVNGFAFNYGNHSKLVARKDGTLKLTQGVQYLNDSERGDYPQLAVLDKSDFTEKLTVERMLFKKSWKSHVSGFSYNPSTGETSPFIAEAPGESGHDTGIGYPRYERQVLADSEDAASRSGRVLAVDNNVYPRLTSALKGNWSSGIDITQEGWFSFSFEDEFLAHGIPWNGTKILLSGMEIAFDPKSGRIRIGVDFEAEAFEEPGNAIIPDPLPNAPPSDIAGYIAGGYANLLYRLNFVTETLSVMPAVSPILVGEAFGLSDRNLFGYYGGGLSGFMPTDAACLLPFGTGISSLWPNANLTIARRGIFSSAINDGSSYGYIPGGNDSPLYLAYNIVDRLSFGTGVTSVNPGGALNIANAYGTSHSDAVNYGYLSGGMHNDLGSIHIETERVDFGTGTFSLYPTGDLAVAMREAAGLSDEISFGYLVNGLADAVGGITSSSMIQIRDFATGVVSLALTTTVSKRSYLSGLSNGTSFGYIIGGFGDSLNQGYTTAEKIDYATGLSSICYSTTMTQTISAQSSMSPLGV